MPTIHRERGYTFRFRALDRGEPPQVHVRGHGGDAKVWLGQPIRKAKVAGYNRAQLTEILSITEAHRDEFLAAWRRFFG